MDHVNQVIDDPAIEISEYGSSAGEPSPISGIDTLGYRAIKKTILQLFPGTTVAPGLVTAGSDSKHYIPVTKNSYRFVPLIYHSGDPARIHGVNECIDIESYIQLVQYYTHLMRNTSEIGTN